MIKRSDFRLLTLASVLCGFAACKEKPVATSAPGEAAQNAPVERPSQRATENIDASEKAEAAKLKAVKDPISEQIMAFRKETRLKYNDRNFEDLEKLAAELRTSKATFGNGSWKIFQFYTSFDCRAEEPEDMWQLHEQIHKDWIAAKPESVTARIAYADFLASYAWKARGSGYAGTVTQAQWKLFAERLTAANQVLKEAAQLPDKDPMLGRVFLTVALGEGWSKAAYDTLIEKVRSEEPTFWSYDSARAYSLLPRWYGEPGDWEAFAEDAASRPNGLGIEVYARIVMDQRPFYENIFRETKASWPKTKEGLEALRKKHPDSLEFVNATAMLATMAQDRELAKAMFDQLGDNYLPSLWRKAERFAHFRNWARTGNW